MSWLNPWVSRSGVVSKIETTPAGRINANIVTNFCVTGAPVRYCGKPLPFQTGDNVIVVGWHSKGRLMACFIALPGRGILIRAYSATLGFVLGALFLLLGGFIIAKVGVLLGLSLAAIAAMQIFHAVAWVEGERFARRLMRRAYQRQR